MNMRNKKHNHLQQKERRMRQGIRPSREETVEEKERRLARNQRKVERRAIEMQIRVAAKERAPRSADRKLKRALRLLERYGLKPILPLGSRPIRTLPIIRRALAEGIETE